MEGIDKILDSDLLEEMRLYQAYAYVKIDGKAKRIYDLCVETNHKELARKIAEKYGKYQEPFKSDLAVSTAILLAAIKSKANE